MGYAFTFDKPHDEMTVGCAFNSEQMNYVRLIMIEAGAVAGDGFEAAMRTAGLETCPDTLPVKKFLSSSAWHITADEAAFIAVRLRRALELNVVPDLLEFFDDSPGSVAVSAWVRQFAEFNERAAEQHGYYVC